MDTYETVEVGETLAFGSYDVTRAEILEFAERYDPQSFHLGDDHHAPYETVIASGWHTAAITMRMLVDNYLLDARTLGSPGLDGLQWRKPVQPGDTLSVTLTFTDKSVWDDDRGMVTQHIETLNQDGDVVQRMDAKALYARES